MQKEAVYEIDGPLLILAGAGSGKTTVLVNRVANMVRFGQAKKAENAPYNVSEEDCKELENLIEKGGEPSHKIASLLAVNAVRPYNILAITFTNKAARELKERLCKMLGEESGNDINASTFHSACVRILRRNADALGFVSNFTIYDADDALRALKEVYKQLQVDDKFLPHRSAMNAISSLKDKMISPEDALAQSENNAKTALVAKIYDAYAKRLKAAGAMDFDDLIYHTVHLLKNNKEVRDYYQNRFKYIMVDEYQDTSVAQFMLVDLLAAGHGNICVVGDDDQSIYKFRGATIENILQFEELFPGAKIIRLEENYRSTSNILDAANTVIKNNRTRKGKTLWTNSEGGSLIEHYFASNEHDEASHIASVIGQNLKDGAKLNDHAILYRMNKQSQPVETYFARAGIPYKVFGGLKFYSRKEVKDILAYMSIVANGNDEIRLKRIINEPSRKIGLTTIDNIAEIALKEQTNMLDVCKHVQKHPKLSRAMNAIMGFNTVYKNLCDAHNSMPLDLFVAEIAHLTGYRQMLENEGEEGQTRLENIGQLISSVKIYADQKGAEASLEGFLEEVALITDMDNYDDSSDVVVMMTMHAAKGLEFPYVFIVGMEENIFPSEMCRYSESELEEERRLCYVGLTRAKKSLFLSSAKERMIFGQTKRNTTSRFLNEIDEDLIETVQSEELARNSYYESQSREYSAEKRGFGGGMASANFNRGATLGQSNFGAASAKKSSGIGQSGFGGGSLNKAASATKSVASGEKYVMGDIVEHKVFGKGIVQKVTPVAGDTIVEVKFEKVGVKKTMANYAPLKKV